MSAQIEISEAWALLEEFERQRLSAESLHLFAEAVDILVEARLPGAIRWVPVEYENLLRAYARSLLSKMQIMDRREEKLVVAVYRLIHQRIYPAIVAAVRGQPSLAKSYDDMLVAWPNFSPFFWPIIGPETSRYLAVFNRRQLTHGC